ncbi:helix-turn-helix domain-containing protein [Streptomyces sp. NPDC050732]|uniref:helix-turn-helix domain-containing protein n=1 Tax=Streptomyces sp. NPDC050732 TaxID=3154632 RepID=UPI00343982BE
MKGAVVMVRSLLCRYEVGRRLFLGPRSPDGRNARAESHLARQDTHRELPHGLSHVIIPPSLVVPELMTFQAARIAKPRALLELTSEPVAQISRSVGYLDVSNCRRLCRRATGVTPSEYRSRFGIAARVSHQEGLSTGWPARIRSTPSR